MRQDDTDDKRTYFRSPERAFRMNDTWYFATREGDQGPYESEESVRAEIARYVTERHELADFQNSREKGSKPHALSLVPLDGRVTRRPPARSVRNRKVFI